MTKNILESIENKRMNQQENGKRDILYITENNAKDTGKTSNCE